MILTIPYQGLQVGNIHLSPFQTDKYGKPLAKLSYKDSSIEFQDVSILSPPMKVLDYNPETSRLRLDLSEQSVFQNKINTLQEYLVSTFFVHQKNFLTFDATNEVVRGLFNFLLNGTVLCLFIYPSFGVKKENNTQCKVSDLQPGDIIRCIIRFTGISQLVNKSGMHLRIQHTIPSIWYLEGKNSS
jgi:hypothetical protein